MTVANGLVYLTGLGGGIYAFPASAPRAASQPGPPPAAAPAGYLFEQPVVSDGGVYAVTLDGTLRAYAPPTTQTPIRRPDPATLVR